jgi:phage baseplate assembly protein W
MDEFLGTDLALVPGLVAHDASEVDLTLRPRPLTEHLRVLLRDLGDEVGSAGTRAFDLDVISGRANLAHGLVLRLLTPVGSLAALGHAEYGSRLHELIGNRKTPALRNLCRAYVLEAVAQEPRVEDKAVALDFDLDVEDASSFAFTLAVQPRQGAPLELSLEVGL